jgi:tetratricopeptide (TPR) repeat protein
VHSEHPADFHVINTLASVYYHAGDFRKSIELLKPAVEQNPDEGRLRLNLGMSYLAMGNRAAALSQYNLIKDSSPDAAELLYRQLSAKYVVTARP